MCLWSCLSYLECTLVFPCAYACDFLCAYDSQVWTGAYLGYRIFNSSSVTAPELPPTEDRLRATFIIQIASRDCLLSQKRSEPSHHNWRTSPKIMSCFHTSQLIHDENWSVALNGWGQLCHDGAETFPSIKGAGKESSGTGLNEYPNVSFSYFLEQFIQTDIY